MRPFENHYVLHKTAANQVFVLNCPNRVYLTRVALYASGSTATVDFFNRSPVGIANAPNSGTAVQAALDSAVEHMYQCYPRLTLVGGKINDFAAFFRLFANQDDQKLYQGTMATIAQLGHAYDANADLAQSLEHPLYCRINGSDTADFLLSITGRPLI